jgi:DNA-directed RNA polymerase specialized sigma24 family protein
MSSSGGPRWGRRSRADDTALSSRYDQADGAAGLGTAPGAVSADGFRDDQPGQGADFAVAVAYRAHYPSLVRIAALLAGVAVAEQVVKDAFASAQRELRRGEASDEALGYLRRAVVTGARARLADPSDPRRHAGTWPAPGIPGSALMAGLSALPVRQREALVLRYYANWSDPQIAAAMGIRRSAVHGHVRRGMSALGACLTAGTGSDT